MKGWKTLGFSLLVSVAGVVQAFDWVTVVPPNKTWTGVVMIGIGAAIAALRSVTDTPVMSAVGRVETLEERVATHVDSDFHRGGH